MLAITIFIKAVFLYQIWKFYKKMKSSQGQLSFLEEANEKARRSLKIAYGFAVCFFALYFFLKDANFEDVFSKEQIEQTQYFK